MEPSLYGSYVPNNIPAIVMAIVCLILTGAHAWKMVTTKQWFGLAIVIGGLFEVVGLAARAVSHDHPDRFHPYVIQLLLILLAPILFAAAVYMFLGRLMRASGHPKLSFIRINWITKIFVVGDIACFLVQALGACVLASAVNSNKDVETKIKVGKNIILAGLGLQVFIFLVFVLCAVVFHVRIIRTGLIGSVDSSLHLSAMIVSVYVCGALMTVRNIYRLLEYKDGNKGYLVEHDWPTYGLDVGLMAILMVITAFWYAADTKARCAGKYGLVYHEDYSHPHVDGTSYDTPPIPMANAAPGMAYHPAYSNAPGNTPSYHVGNDYANSYYHA